MKKLIKILGRFLLGIILTLIAFFYIGLFVNIAFEDDAILFFVAFVFFIIHCIGGFLLLAEKGGKLKHIFLSIGIVGFLVLFVCYCELYPLTDEELCSDTGICSEKVINKEKCAELEGTWKKVEDEWFCRLKWADVKE